MEQELVKKAEEEHVALLALKNLEENTKKRGAK
jgi:hypothetical protein